MFSFEIVVRGLWYCKAMENQELWNYMGYLLFLDEFSFNPLFWGGAVLDY